MKRELDEVERLELTTGIGVGLVIFLMFLFTLTEASYTEELSPGLKVELNDNTYRKQD